MKIIEDSQFTDETYSRNLTFNWQKSTVSNSHTGKTLPIPSNTQDLLSCYLAIAHDLKHKRTPLSCQITDGEDVKQYHFSQHGIETLQTTLGTVEAVVVQYQHKKRLARFWLAPKYDYLVVKAEYFLNDQWNISAKLMTYE